MNLGYSIKWALETHTSGTFFVFFFFFSPSTSHSNLNWLLTKLITCCFRFRKTQIYVKSGVPRTYFWNHCSRNNYVPYPLCSCFLTGILISGAIMFFKVQNYIILLKISNLKLKLSLSLLTISSYTTLLQNIFSNILSYLRIHLNEPSLFQNGMHAVL